MNTGTLCWQTRGMNLMDRFMLRVIMIPECECWLWSLHHDKDGYARIELDGKTRQAHIVGYEMFVGPVPKGMQLDHKCRNRSCVNFRHLEPVTHIENQRRSPITMMNKAECNHGHGPEYFKRKGDRRICVICQREGWIAKHKRDKIRFGIGDTLDVRTHCNHGHEFTPENTWMKKKVESGKRYRSCRECQRLRRVAKKGNP